MNELLRSQMLTVIEEALAQCPDRVDQALSLTVGRGISLELSTLLREVAEQHIATPEAYRQWLAEQAEEAALMKMEAEQCA
ncbi:MAG: hypothetical protein LAT50_16895 [Ectothiorhodospiraceae bacterium]|nr:hypothetical protein [Ectothiorhodospiraceae bacterium]